MPEKPNADPGIFDEKGYSKVVGRKKEMIPVSGFKVHPKDVLAVAAGRAGVAGCAGAGVPGNKCGAAVKLYVKVPRSVRFVDTLPQSEILHRELRYVG